MGFISILGHPSSFLSISSSSAAPPYFAVPRIHRRPQGWEARRGSLCCSPLPSLSSSAAPARAQTPPSSASLATLTLFHRHHPLTTSLSPPLFVLDCAPHSKPPSRFTPKPVPSERTEIFPQTLTRGRSGPNLSIISLSSGYLSHEREADDEFVAYEELPDEFVRASRACLGFARDRSDVLGFVLSSILFSLFMVLFVLFTNCLFGASDLMTNDME
ncbi:hypothetical protein Acr_12g0006110 [Actinidia rufa]|uniref:Uncharacterized protein n=1 Tax=Actinidia rufa TaxID=165716 RepID=A0A7J0FHA1_9ERIC|nr:hypothetical protein Acr_12g0006110 [Actinidia rufa]